MSADFIAYQDGVWEPSISVGGERKVLRFEVEKGDKIYFDADCNGMPDMEGACVCEATLLREYMREEEIERFVE